MGNITLRRNHAIGDAQALRDLFPIKAGSILDRKAIAKELENLNYAYRKLGYINFTALPSPTYDDKKKLGFLDIEVDEGKKFYVSSIDIVGADSRVLNDLPLTKRSGL